jgi:hypothetical protein
MTEIAPNDSLNDITLGSLKPWRILEGRPLISGKTFGVNTPLGFCTPLGSKTLGLAHMVF